MKKYVTILTNPQKAFENLNERGDWNNEKPTTLIVLIAGALPFLFMSGYDIIKPAIPKDEGTPDSIIWFSYLMPIVFGTIVFFAIFKYLIPYFMHLIAKSQSYEAENINMARYIVAFALIPRITLAPFSGINLFSNELIYKVIEGVSMASIILILLICFMGVKTVYKTDNLKAIFIMLPFMLLTLISQLANM